MHNGNWFAVSRMVFDHYVVGAGQTVKPADPKKGAYSRLEAWLWLVANAAYENSKIVNRGREMDLQPGQLMGAYAYLSDVWNWTPDTTRHFLKRLELTLMITRWCDKQKHNGITNQCQILSVCNYERYQITHKPEPQAVSQAVSQPTPQARPKHTPSEPQESNTKQITLKKDPHVTDATLALDETDGSSGLKHSDALACFNAYNELALRVGLPQARSLDPSRKKKILARLRDHGGMEAWNLLIANISRSALLQGKKTNWRPPGLHWFLEPNNFVKVIEGGYGNGAHADLPTETIEETQARYERILAGPEHQSRGDRQ